MLPSNNHNHLHAFSKSERLCGKVRIQNLYAKGSKFVVWPLRVTYVEQAEGLGYPEVLIWAPKALFKHAVQRNLLRRRMREAYRQNKTPLLNRNLQIAFNYIDKSVQPYQVIEKAMQKAITKLTLSEQLTNSPAN